MIGTLCRWRASKQPYLPSLLLSSFLFVLFTIPWLAFSVLRWEVMRICHCCGSGLSSEAESWERDQGYLEMLASGGTQPRSAHMTGSILCLEAWSAPGRWVFRQRPRSCGQGAQVQEAKSGPHLGWEVCGLLGCSFHLHVGHMGFLSLFFPHGMNLAVFIPQILES